MGVAAAAQDDRLGARVEIEHRDLGGVQAAGHGGHGKEDTATAGQDFRPEVIGLAPVPVWSSHHGGFSTSRRDALQPCRRIVRGKENRVLGGPGGAASTAVESRQGERRPTGDRHLLQRPVVVDKADPLPVWRHEDTAEQTARHDNRLV